MKIGGGKGGVFFHADLSEIDSGSCLEEMRVEVIRDKKYEQG